MNTQLQRMIMVLFLVLTIIAVTVLFWLPINNTSSRILAARENNSTNLLNLIDPDIAVENIDIGLSSAPALPQEPTQNEAVQKDLLADEDRLREMAESQEYSNTSDQDTQGDYGKLPVVPAAVAPPKQQLENTNYGYDVMGNPRNHISDYPVSPNDWFSTITGKHWEDLFMWPDLYTMNMDNLRSTNPDLIFPGEKISIYESLIADGEFSETDKETLLQAYLKVYQVYKQAGESKALAAAQLLASAVRYEKDFLEKYANFLAPQDKQMAQKLIKEQKFLD